MEKKVYTIPEIERENIIKTFTQFEKKAVAYGNALSYDLSAPYAKERVIWENVFDPSTGVTRSRKCGVEMVEAFDLSVECDFIRKNGYSVDARLEHTENGSLVTLISARTINPAWVTLPPVCEHCHSNRQRKVTFIVSKDGVEKQIGSTCLQDYCGIDPNAFAYLNQLQALILNDFDMNSYRFGEHSSDLYRVFDAVHVLAAAIRIEREHGYISTREAGSNKSVMLKEIVDYHMEESNEMLAEAQEIADAIKSMERCEAADENMSDLWVILQNGYVLRKHFGYIAYAPVAFRRYLERKAKAEQREKMMQFERSSSWVAEIGQRIFINVKEFQIVTSWENDYGFTYLCKIMDDSNNVFIWFASNPAHVKEAATIKGTVKEHTERDGVKQTIITRCQAA